MNSESDHLASLFEEASEIPTAEGRSNFLDAACGADQALRAELERLLSLHAGARGFLRSDPDLNGESPRQPREGGIGPEKAGDQVGPYHLMGLIGEGGSSTVYLAEQRSPVRRWVALKIVKPGMDTQRVISRFELERQALALMDHPGIAKVFDAGSTASGRPYFVMEWVRGVEITRHCDEHRLTVAERLDLFSQVCQAVLHAHQKGVIHRDLKPANVLVSVHDGKAFPKIIDFGIAKVVRGWASDGTPKNPGLPLLGTPAYMSPEQTEMTNSDLDTRTDIYSLGVLLYELLTGQPPFSPQLLQEAGLDVMRRTIRFAEPARPSLRVHQHGADEECRRIALARRTTPESLQRALQGDLDWITLKALEKERDRRYDTAASLADDIVRHRLHRPVSAAAQTCGYRLRKLLRRNRKTAIGVAGGLVLLLAGLGGSYWLASRARENAWKADELQQSVQDAELESHAAMVEMLVSSGLSASAEGTHDRALLWFAQAARACSAKEVGREINALRVRAWQERVALPIGAFWLAATPCALAFSPDSRFLAAVGGDGESRVWDCAVGVEVAWTENAGAVRVAAWSLGGEMLAVGLADREVKVLNTSDGGIRHAVPLAEAPTVVGFTPDGRYLVCGSRVLRLWDLQRGSFTRARWVHPEPVTALAFSHESGLVATACADGLARVFRTDEEEGSEILGFVPVPHRQSVRTGNCPSKTKYREDFLDVPHLSAPAFLSGGERLATRTGAYEITVWEIATCGKVYLIDDICCSCGFVVSSDGRLMACGVQDGKIGLWDVPTGRPAGVFPSHGDCVLDVALGAQGNTLLSGGANHIARMWSLPNGEELNPPMRHANDVDEVALARCGRIMATAQSDGLVRIWSLPGNAWEGRVLASEDGPKRARLDDRGEFVLAVREPAWQATMTQTSVYSLASGERRGASIEFEGCLEDAALSPDGTVVAALVSGLDGPRAGVLEFRDVLEGLRTGAPIQLLSRPAALAWHPDGSSLAVVSQQGELLVAGPPTAPRLTRLREASVVPRRLNFAVDFTSDGTYLASLTVKGEVEVRRTSDWRLPYPPLGSEEGGYWSFKASLDGRHLATTTLEGEVTVWELATGEPVGPPLEHGAWVYRCRFGPRGRLLATAGHDGLVKVWDWRNRVLECEPLLHPNEVYDVAFSADGRRVLTACQDGAVRVWEIQDGRLIAPPFPVGAQAFNIEVSAGGAWAAVGSLGPGLHVLSLAFLREDDPWSPDDLCLLGEVVSGSEISGGRPRELSTAVWLERYAKLRNLHPEIFYPPARSVDEKLTPGSAESRPRPTTRPGKVESADAACPYRNICGEAFCGEVKGDDAAAAGL